VTVSLLVGPRLKSLADSLGPPAVADVRSLPAGSADRVEICATLAGPVPRFLIGRRPPKIVHRPKSTTHMVDIVHRRLTSCLYVSNTYARLELVSQLQLQVLVAPLRKAARVYGGRRSK
jgi:hypothetical protein